MQPLVLTSFSTCLKTEQELNVETGTKRRDISPLPEEMEKIPMAPSEVKGEMYERGFFVTRGKMSVHR